MSLSTPAELTASRPGALGAARRFLFNPQTRQKLLAFASLVALMVFFSFASTNFLQADNMVSILQSTAVNGVLAVAVTFVIITGGIDLSIGVIRVLLGDLRSVGLISMYEPPAASQPHDVDVLKAVVNGLRAL